MKKLLFVALLGLACLGWTPARALEITLVPRGGYQIAPGGELLVELGISGLRSGGLDTELGAFHLDLYFDPDLLSYISTAPSSWGDGLGSTNDINQALAFSDDSAPGLLRLDEVSLLDELTLAQLQGDSFRLATLAFRVLPGLAPVPGNTLLFVDDILLGDAGGTPIALAPGQFPVLILQVDEPATPAILGLGMAAMVWCRRRRRGG
jgi:hypothetical protein